MEQFEYVLGTSGGLMASLLQPVKRFVRRRVDARGPRLRVTVARLMERLGLPGNMRRLAAQFQREGAWRDSLRCWLIVHAATPADAAVLEACWTCALAAGDVATVRRLYREARGEMGVPPFRAIRLAAELACHGHAADAGDVVADWMAGQDDVLAACRHMPSLVSPLFGPEVAMLAQRLRSADAPAARAAAFICLARLCFTFGNVVMAARLYRRLETAETMTDLDRVAMHYGAARDALPMPDTVDADVIVALAEPVADPHALMALVQVAVVNGHASCAHALLARAMRARHADAPSLDALSHDVAAMLDVLMGLRLRPLDLGDDPGALGAAPASPVPKRFVCGFGWSGSGAVYDAIRGHAGFCEFEGAGEDAILNVDSDTEATFIQSRAGLGDLWKRLKTSQEVSWENLWDLFRCHVVGLCPTGYSEYKAAAAAANHVGKYGTRYTGVFRTFFDGLADGFEHPRSGQWHALFVRTTESLCRMLIEQTGSRVVLLNNAVFARNAVMLDIFSGYRAVMVYRDPRDVFVDRRRHDRNHWRSPVQMADFYGQGMAAYMKCKKDHSPLHAQSMREVAFERFVKDATFRECVCTWLTEGVEAQADQVFFDPGVSCRNIGLYRDELGPEDRENLEMVVGRCHDMDRLAEASWASEKPAFA